MFRVQLTPCRVRKGAGRSLLLGLACLLGAGAWSASCAAAARTPPAAQAVQSAPAVKPDPEVLLIQIYKELGADNLRSALAKADKLVEAYPNFRLGHLVRGDLLLMQTRPVTTFGDVNGPEDKLRNLRDEAAVRLQSLRFKPDPNLLPRAILQLRDDQKHALLVDASHSRLYVYENQGGRPRLVTDYYVSQGKLGVNKLKTGDQKTPIGVYYITGHLSGARLPDFYGSGALPLNYPNEWDKLNGRSGFGIWLHGTPSDSYSRPPLSSDGCVVLTNPDLHKLSGSVEIGKTPVIISERPEFVTQAKWNSDRAMATGLVERWRRDIENLDVQRVVAHYSSRFKSDRDEDLATWFNRYRQLMGSARDLSVKLRDASYFFYPGRDDMIVSTFTQDTRSGRSTTTVRKRQYWVKEGAQWKIIYEMTF